MLPSDEKTPALNMSQAAGSENPAVPLQNMQQGSPYSTQAPTQNNDNATQVQSTAQPVISSAPMMSPLFQSAQSAQPPTPIAGNENSPTDEAVWMERTKNVVNQTANDPYKRVQMLQQLQDLYQKEHFGSGSSGEESR